MNEAIRSLIPRSWLLSYHKTLVFLAAAYYGFPADRMIIIGVTGTKGKTTTANYIADMLESAGFPTAVISTAQFRLPSGVTPNTSKMTMPGRTRLQKFLHRAQRQGCRYVVIETSSEGIAQGRMTAISYDIAVFSNLSPEHIESHGSFENYKNAKLRLFKKLAKSKHKHGVKKVAIANLDDEFAHDFLDEKADIKFGYTHEDATAPDHVRKISASNIETEQGHVSFELTIDGLKDSVSIPVTGAFQVENILAAICVGLSQNIRWTIMKAGLSRVRPVPGRVEFIEMGQPFSVVLDYAHEPKSLEAILTEAKKLTKNKVIVVTGAQGGGRDKGKRPKMGKIAYDYADFVVVTNEDPYDEDPATIIEDVAHGIVEAGGQEHHDFEKVADRGAAITLALEKATPGDVVVVAGKGSETVMAVAHNQKIAWSDRDVIRQSLKDLKATTPSQ